MLERKIQEMEKPFDIKERSYIFGIQVIKLLKVLPKNTAAFVITDQLIRSAMSIGANIAEGSAASSKKDFINFYNHALKSAVETIFWLRALVDAELLEKSKVEPFIKEANELSKILGSIVSKSKIKR